MLHGFCLLAAIACTLTAAVDPLQHLSLRCDGSTINCRTHSEISRLISDLKEENRRLQLSVDSNCTICWSDPCFNGGTCVPLSRYNYRCDCPPDYGGSLCEKKIECTKKSCGKNADCYVANHQVNCVCKYGYSGNAKYGCSVKTAESCMNGDPHYKTFDGQRYEYQGTCPYIFTLPCNYTGLEPFSFFSVKAKNELSYHNAHVSTVSEVEVEMYGQRLHVDSGYHLYVNGVRKKMPYYYPCKSNAKIKVKISWFKVEISNDQFVKVTFGFGQLCVEIPNTPALNGPDVLCGLAGNLDEHCENDFRYKNGTVWTVKGCNHREQHATELFGDSWITDDFMPLQSGPPQVCLTGNEVDNETLTCDLANAKKACMPLLEAEANAGVFADCAGLGNATIENAYDNCVFDVCRDKNLLCDSFATFVRICQTVLPKTAPDWRPATGCPALACGLHSSPSTCATGCPATCTNTNVTTECVEGCLEGCECDPGYVLDFTDPKNPRCIAIQDCGCVDSDGNSHEPTDQWLNNNCTMKNWCANGTYHYVATHCSPHGYCGVDNFKRECICNTGFVGDGFNCTDIDECADPTRCGADKGHGTCTNTPGSYICTCNGYYSGRDCENYLPKRHCADLKVFHGKDTDGVYTIEPPYPYNGQKEGTPLDVYCDMTSDGGGWTLMSNSLSDSMSNKTYAQYTAGFGDPATQDLWLGLEVIHGMTNDVLTSLRLNLHRCTHNGHPEVWTWCSYPRFSILDAGANYAVVIPEVCTGGSENNYYDGWARWDLNTVGPVFLAFDADNSIAECTKTYRNTGWWFDTTTRCGPANLNGNRYSCKDVPDDDALGHYLHWNGDPLSEATLYLRPKEFPNYDTVH